jgi:hypothetical protein
MKMNMNDEETHYKFATLSSESPVTLELKLFVILRIFSRASYLDMIWYAVNENSVPAIFWSTVFEINEALDNINFPSDRAGIANSKTSGQLGNKARDQAWILFQYGHSTCCK